MVIPPESDYFHLFHMLAITAGIKNLALRISHTHAYSKSKVLKIS